MPKKTKTADSPDSAELVAELYASEASEALAHVRSVGVVDQTSIVAATKQIADLKEYREAVVMAWDSFASPLKKAIDEIQTSLDRQRSFFMRPIGFIDAAEADLKAKIVACINGLEVARAELVYQAGIEASDGNVQASSALISEAGALEVSKVKGLDVRTSWDGEVTDPTKIPREYLLPDVKTLKAKTRAWKGDPKIPGWRAFPVSTAAVTVAKVER